jgi:L-alanine-DL-glutamate epimerase-like enolase superfamily enzyme
MGRYGQGSLIRERFLPRILEADSKRLMDEKSDNLDPTRIWECMMTNEKPGGHGERSVAVGTIDMAVWDAVAKIAEKPLFRLLAERYGNGAPDPKAFVYAGGFPDGVKVQDGYVTMPELPGIGFEGKADLYREMKALSN